MKSNDFDLATDIVTLLDLLSTSDKDHVFHVELMLKMTTAVIQYFFFCITETGNLKFFRYEINRWIVSCVTFERFASG